MRKIILLVSLLLLSILNDHQASGIRLIGGSLSSAKEDLKNVNVEKNDLMRRSNEGMRTAAETAKKEDHISETGSNRKFMTKTSTLSSTSTTTTSKNDKNVHEEGNNKGESTVLLRKGNQSSRIERSLVVGKEENFNVNSSTVLPDGHQHSQPDRSNVDPGHYPDILDIAGMDYSPAKRKTPIHN